MAQANINIRVEEKYDMENLCQRLEMNLTTAVTVFFKKPVMEQAIPFRVSADPLYSEINQFCIHEAISRLDAGLGNEHELIEAEE